MSPKTSRAVTLTRAHPHRQATTPRPFEMPVGGRSRLAAGEALKSPAWWKGRNRSPQEEFAANSEAGALARQSHNHERDPARTTVESFWHPGVERLPDRRWRDLRTGKVYVETALIPTSEETQDWTPDARIIFRDELPRSLHKAQRELWPADDDGK